MPLWDCTLRLQDSTGRDTKLGLHRDPVPCDNLAALLAHLSTNLPNLATLGATVTGLDVRLVSEKNHESRQ